MSATGSYYGRPILKEPVWKPEIPVYFFTGGLGGASAVLSLVARAAGNEKLARRALLVSAGSELVSPILLVSDLGRPDRFLNMLRVFKPTSPMSVGSWVLALDGAVTSLAVALDRAGKLPRVKIAAETLSAMLGLPLATYTAVLIADTAIPVWHEARRELPFVFAASSAAAAGAAGMAVVPPGEAAPARRLLIAGVVGEGLAMRRMRRRLGTLGEPYGTGTSGRLAKAARALALSGAVLAATAGRRRRTAAVAGAALVLGGEVALRWAVFKAGAQSASDPRYTVQPQRERAAGRAAPGA